MDKPKIIVAFDTFEKAREYRSAAGYWSAFYEIIPWFGLCVITFNWDKYQGMVINDGKIYNED